MNNILRCRICGKVCKHLGSHLFHRHDMLARDYKTKFELPWKMGLVTPEIKRKQREANFRHNASKNPDFIKGGKKNQFKKGRTGQRRISTHERQVIMARILSVNKRKKVLQQCPVCRMQYNHVESHMLQVHKLISVKDLVIRESYENTGRRS